MRADDFDRTPRPSRPLLDPDPARALRQMIGGALAAFALTGVGYVAAQVTQHDTHHRTAHTTTTR